MFETFKPTNKLIQQLNFKRLLENSDNEHVYDFIVFILRYYPEVGYKHFKMDEVDLEKLKREEVKRVWETIHSTLVKIDGLKGDMKSRSVNNFNYFL